MIMKRSLKTLCGFFAVLALLVSCNATTPLAYDGPLPHKELHNYFYANNADNTPPTKITSEDTFERYFGESAYMGKSGEPTKVNFGEQFVIALVLPETKYDTQILPQRLIKRGDRITLYYKVRQGKARSFTIRPIYLVKVDSQYEAEEVVTVREK